jgi:hypothetical protein
MVIIEVIWLIIILLVITSFVVGSYLHPFGDGDLWRWWVNYHLFGDSLDPILSVMEKFTRMTIILLVIEICELCLTFILLVIARFVVDLTIILLVMAIFVVPTVTIILLVMTILKIMVNLCHPFGVRKPIPPLSSHQKQPVQDLSVDSRVGIDVTSYPYYPGIHCIFTCIAFQRTKLGSFRI